VSVMRNVVIHPRVFEIAPDYVRFVVQARGNVGAVNPQWLNEEFERALAGVVAHYGGVKDLAEVEPALGWREAFRTAGWSGSKFRSSVEALLRRAARGELTQLGIPLVDAGTIATLKHLVPIGVHIVDDLPPGDLVLGPASGSEVFAPFDGSIEHPDAGEIIYKCGDRVLTRRWVWRQGVLGSIAGTPEMLAVNVDVLKPSLLNELAVHETVKAALEASGAQVMKVHRLGQQSNSAQLLDW
jgi:DNA/RNA-binding domain of Phe-tRNA-synthetase-like protein